MDEASDKCIQMSW